MRILFLSHYFPPEVNAPAIRTHEHARRWVADGHEVTVITGVPNHSKGELFPGYENRWLREEEAAERARAGQAWVPGDFVRDDLMQRMLESVRTAIGAKG